MGLQTDLVLQLHLQPTGRVEPIAPEIGVYFTADKPTRSSFVFQLRSFDIDIPAGEPAYRIAESLVLPADVEVLGVYPHAHYIAKDLRIFAIMPDGREQGLLHIPQWDFNWQGDYRLQTPLGLPAGTELHMVYVYDNSADNPFNPSHPPQRVRGGWNSTDEMAEAMIQVVPLAPADLPLLADAQLAYDVTKSSGQARYHYFNGSYLQEQREWQQARTAFELARELDPQFPSVYFKLDEVQEAVGDPDGAEFFFDEALRRQPEMISAALGKVRVLMRTNRFDQAGEMIRQIWQAHPQHLSANLYLTRFLRTIGEMDAALALFAERLPAFQNEPAYRWEYGMLLRQQGRSAAALPHLQFTAQSTSFDRGHRAEAFLSLAHIRLEADEADDAIGFIDQCLALDPMHLDALLQGANILLSQADPVAAKRYLADILLLPAEARFSDHDILINLPQPAGGLLLAEIYVSQGSPEVGDRVLELAIQLLSQQGKTRAIHPLEERRQQIHHASP